VWTAAIVHQDPPFHVCFPSDRMLAAWRAIERKSILLPDYTIRESTRAKHVRFKVSLADGLVIVIPAGFDHTRIPELLEEKQAWLLRSLREVERLRASMPSPDLQPLQIELPSVGQIWQLDWVETDNACISIREVDGFRLQISGPVENPAAWRAALKRWLIERGKDVLIPWTKDLSRDLDVPIQRVGIRCQKTRWGSYSSKGTVSLNAQLLLLPRELVRYVLIHEICHAVHANHSSQFWRLVRQWEPEADAYRSQLRTASQYVPNWLRSNY